MPKIKQIPKNTSFSIIESWNPTNQLRWKKLNHSNKELQQLWQGSRGNQEWREIEFENED